MSIIILKGIEVNRPDTTPLKSSIMDHATVAENAHFGLVNDAGLWPSYNMLNLDVPTALCADPKNPVEKTFVAAPWIPAFEFAMYGGVQCSNVGLDMADMASETKRVFEAIQGRGVEQALLGTRFVANAGTTDPRVPAQSISWAAPTDLTATGPTGLLSAYASLALLEGYAAANYAGVPTIHAPRAVTTLLEVSGLIKWIGDKAFTQNGSKVAMGGGYDTGEADGTWDMFATGEVYIEASGEVNVQQHTIPGYVAAHPSDPNNLTDNTTITLAERMYRVAVDGFVAKATVKVW